MRSATYTYTARPNAEARDRQREACRAAAHAAGLTEVACVHDEAGDRSGLARVHELARAGGIDAVVVWNLDRFGRTLGALQEQTAAFAPEGVQIVVADPQARDLDRVFPPVLRAAWDRRTWRRGPSSATAPRPAPVGPGALSRPRRR